MKLHTDKKTILVAATMALALSLPVLAEDDGGKDEMVKLTDCPAEVQKTIQEKAGTGEIIGIEKEAEEGAMVYEAKVKMADGQTMEFEVAADGKLIKAEAEDKSDKDEDKDDDKDDKDEKDDD